VRTHSGGVLGPPEREIRASEHLHELAEQASVDAADPEFRAWILRDRAAAASCESSRPPSQAVPPLASSRLARAMASAAVASRAFVDQEQTPVGASRSEAAPSNMGGAPTGVVSGRAVDCTHTPAAAKPGKRANVVRERGPLTSNPRKLRYHRRRITEAQIALHKANQQARKDRVDWLRVPREVFDVCSAICDDSNAVAGALDWIRQTRGPAVAFEAEASCLYRVRGGTQRDDWSTPRARRKLALLTFLSMSPHALARSAVTGSPSDEQVLVTAGVPQTLIVKLVCSSQREPYSIRTLQRDLAEIDECSELLLRWRTPVAHAEPWECGGAEHGVINRYCIRAAMVREQWKRAVSAVEAQVKAGMLSMASWMVWRPASARGSPVCAARGGALLVPS
jgi:hypothetical protein